MTTRIDGRSVTFTLELGICQSYKRETWDAANHGRGYVDAEVTLSYEPNFPKPAGVAALGIRFEHTPLGDLIGGESTSRGSLRGLEFASGTLGAAVVFVQRGYAFSTMHSGCEHQRAAGWESPAEVTSHSGVPCPVCGHAFAREWRIVEIPDEVIALVRSWRGKEIRR